LIGVGGAVRVTEAPRPITELNIEVAKLQIFNRTTSKVLEFLIVYKLFIRIRIRETVIEEQI